MSRDRDAGVREADQARAELYETLAQLRDRLDYAQRIDDAMDRAGDRLRAEPATAAAYEAALTSPIRTAADMDRDTARHAADTLAFAEVKPGQKIADIRPSAGYFTRLFARVVGEGGHVYAFVPNRTAERENPRADALVAAYPNVSRVNGDLDAMTFDQPLDVVFMSQEYHDFHIPRFGVDVTKMNADIFKALKPGGLFVVIDHQAAPGAANTAVAADGAAFCLLVSDALARRLGLQGARILGAASLGADPEWPGLAPVPAIRAVLAQAGLTPEDLDAVELMEAFAIQAMACADLAGRIEDFGPVEPHRAYVARLKAEHGKKTGFWPRMDG